MKRITRLLALALVAGGIFAAGLVGTASAEPYCEEGPAVAAVQDCVTPEPTESATPSPYPDETASPTPSPTYASKSPSTSATPVSSLPATQPPVIVPSLPLTGGRPWIPAAVGLILAGAGAALIVLGRRRQRRISFTS
jgi:LPXTG-motif cell wall-anchored protein